MANLAQVVRQLQGEKSRLEEQLSKVNSAIAALRGLSRKGTGGRLGVSRPARFLSTAARSRIAAAQRVRWAKWRKQKAAA